MTALRSEKYLNPILDELTFIREMSKAKINKLQIKQSGTIENKHSPQIDSLKNYVNTPINNNNFDINSKKSYVVIDNSSIISTNYHKQNGFSNKEWENIYFKMY